MQNRIQIWLDRDMLGRAASALREVAANRRQGILLSNDGNYPKDYEDSDALDGVRQLEKDAHDLELYLEWQPQEYTEGSQLDDIEALLEEFRDGGYYIRGGRLADSIRGVIQQADRRRVEAHDTYASLVEEMRVNLRALQFMVGAALRGETHRIKNSRLYAARDAIDTMVLELNEIDVDNPQSYEAGHYYGGRSWDFKKLASENFHLRKQIKALQAKLDGMGSDEHLEATDEE